MYVSLLNQSHKTDGNRLNTFRLLLAEDHEMVRAGIKLLVNAEADMEIVGEADNGESAIEKAQKLLPDIIVMDISMPKLNGLTATKRIKQICPYIKILILTRYEDDSYLQQLLNAGANGYVLKQSAPSELIGAIRAIGHGKSYLDPSLTARVMNGYIKQSAAPDRAGNVNITQREMEILRLLALGYSYKEISCRLEICVKTIEVHKTNIMRKLNFKSRADIVRYAILEGWMQVT